MSPVFSRPKLYQPKGQIILSVVVLQIVEAVKEKEDMSAVSHKQRNKDQTRTSNKSALKRQKWCSDRNISDPSEEVFKG